MDRETSGQRIADAAKTLFTYCRARTNSREEAEDLSQDILLELLRGRGNLRDDRAFYGFMWAVAGNVYKNWCKRRARPANAPLDERLPDGNPPFTGLLEKETDLALLRRELALLTERHRRVTVLYYFEGLRVGEIAQALGLSEGMVKFLLFKSRQILKEGMDMERTPGNLSYNPGHLRMGFWGKGSNPYKLVEDSLIAQNILLACYNDRCTAEEISLQIGVAVPYLEKDLKALCEHNVLTCRGGRYETSIVIFTREFVREADTKTQPFQQEIAGIIETGLHEKLADIKAIGFDPGVEDSNLLRWHVAAILLEKAVIGKYQGSMQIATPTRFPGCEAFVTGEEDPGSRWFGGFGTSWGGNAAGDLIRFLDFAVNGEMDHFYFFNYPNRVNVLLDIANGKSNDFSENDKNEIAELIRRGYVCKAGDALRLRLPVFTKERFELLLDMLDGVTDEIAEKTRAMVEAAKEILIQYTPAALRREAESASMMMMFDAISAPAQLMLDNGTLGRVGENEHPTAYVVLQ